MSLDRVEPDRVDAGGDSQLPVGVPQAPDVDVRESDDRRRGGA